MSSPGQKLVAGRIPGERIETTEATADSAGFTGTEGVMATVVAPLVIGRTYRVTFDAGLQITVTGVVRVRIREDSVAGSQMQLRDPDATAGRSSPARAEVEYTAAATGNKTFVATGAVLSGGGTANLDAAAALPAYLYVDYIRG